MERASCCNISFVHELAVRLLKTIRKQESIRAGDRIAVAVSGGSDSVALFCLLLELRSELGIVLTTAHVNHKLRGEESDGDALFVAELARQQGLELHSVDAPATSANQSGIEAEARKLRYAFFRELARTGRVSKIATAHTLDDQAETVLLRMFRGTGIRGLAGIHPRLVFEEQGHSFGEVLRPLLGFRKEDLHQFLREQNQPWREDSSNLDIAFLRNRVRHKLLPVISEEFGDRALEHLSEIAEIARAEEEYWATSQPESRTPTESAQSAKDDNSAVHSLPVSPLLALPLAAQRRRIRAWLEENAPDSSISFRRIEDTLDLARGESGRVLELSAIHNLRREQQNLLLELGTLAAESKLADYEYAMTVPGVIQVPELSARIEVSVVNPANVPEDERGQLLYLGRIPKQIVIRNWRAGDRFWPAHTGEEKKVKELLTDRHASGIAKKLWPVALVEDCGLVWMRGFPVPAVFRAPAGTPKAIWIREIAGMM